jgi:hypothetical protein
MITLKISLGLFFNRIMNEKWQKKALAITMSITLFVGIGYWLFSIFQCGIPNKGAAFWQKKLGNMCASDATAIGLGYTSGLVNAIGDVILCGLPIPVILKARLSSKEKAIISGIFVLATT